MEAAWRSSIMAVVLPLSPSLPTSPRSSPGCDHQPNLSLISWLVKLYSRWGATLQGVILALLAALAGRCYFWLIFTFPYISKGGRSAPIKFYVCFLQMGSTVDISKELSAKIVVLFTELSALCCCHPSPPLCWHSYSEMGRSLSSHLHVKNASTN